MLPTSLQKKQIQAPYSQNPSHISKDQYFLSDKTIVKKYISWPEVDGLRSDSDAKAILNGHLSDLLPTSAKTNMVDFIWHEDLHIPCLHNITILKRK